MSKEKELDDILESLKEHKDKGNKDIEPILPPEIYDKQDDLLWIDSNDIKQKLNSTDEIEPPKIYRKENESPSQDEKGTQNKPSKKIKFSFKLNLNKKDKEDKAETDSNEKEEKGPFVLTFQKLLAIVIAVLIVITACVAGILYCYKNNLYWFEDKVIAYSYDTDILEEYKNSYYSNNAYSGELVVGDSAIQGSVFNTKSDTGAYFYNGSDISKNQQIMSIDVSNFGDALEKMYSSADLYVNSNQEVVLNTLFEKKTYKVISAYYTNKAPEDNGGYVFPYTINGNLTKQSFAEYRDGLKARRLYNTGYDIMYDDEVLNLCADSNSLMPNYKFVVVCIKADKIDQTTIIGDTGAVYYPQNYYDARNLVNPYKNAMGLHWSPLLKLDDEENETKKLKQEDYIEKE